MRDQMTEEGCLRGVLVEMQMRYMKEAEPILEALSRIESLKPPPPIFIDAHRLPQSIIDQLKDMEPAK